MQIKDTTLWRSNKRYGRNYSGSAQFDLLPDFKAMRSIKTNFVRNQYLKSNHCLEGKTRVGWQGYSTTHLLHFA